MSTNMLNFQKQIRQIYFIDKKVELDALDDAPLTESSIAVDERYTTGIPHPFVSFQVKERGTGKQVHTDRVFLRKINYVNLKKPVKKIGKLVKIDFSGLAADITSYEGKAITILLKSHYTDHTDTFVVITASYTVKAGDTVEKIIEALAGALAMNIGHDFRFRNEAAPNITIGDVTCFDNYFYDIRINGNVLEIQEKDFIASTYSLSMPYDDLLWNVTASFGNLVMDLGPLKIFEVNGVQAQGQGYQLKEAEAFLGRNRAEYATWNLKSKGKEFLAELGKEYFVLDVSYYHQSRDESYHSDKILTLVSEDEQLLTSLADVFGEGLNLEDNEPEQTEVEKTITGDIPVDGGDNPKPDPINPDCDPDDPNCDPDEPKHDAKLDNIEVVDKDENTVTLSFTTEPGASWQVDGKNGVADDKGVVSVDIEKPEAGKEKEVEIKVSKKGYNDVSKKKTLS